MVIDYLSKWRRWNLFGKRSICVFFTFRYLSPRLSLLSVRDPQSQEVSRIERKVSQHPERKHWMNNGLVTYSGVKVFGRSGQQWVRLRSSKEPCVISFSVGVTDAECSQSSQKWGLSGDECERENGGVRSNAVSPSHALSHLYSSLWFSECSSFSLTSNFNLPWIFPLL